MLTGSLLVKKFAAFYGTECSLAQLQEPATFLYPEQDQPSPCSPSHFLKIHLKIVVPSKPGSSKWSLSVVLSPKLCMHLSCPPYVLHGMRISLFLI
jgi:hypothetical protein